MLMRLNLWFQLSYHVIEISSIYKIGLTSWTFPARLCTAQGARRIGKFALATPLARLYSKWQSVKSATWWNINLNLKAPESSYVYTELTKISLPYFPRNQRSIEQQHTRRNMRSSHWVLLKSRCRQLMTERQAAMKQLDMILQTTKWCTNSPWLLVFQNRAYCCSNIAVCAKIQTMRLIDYSLMKKDNSCCVPKEGEQELEALYYIETWNDIDSTQNPRYLTDLNKSGCIKLFWPLFDLKLLLCLEILSALHHCYSKRIECFKGVLQGWW